MLGVQNQNNNHNNQNINKENNNNLREDFDMPELDDRMQRDNDAFDDAISSISEIATTRDKVFDNKNNQSKRKYSDSSEMNEESDEIKKQRALREIR